MRTQEEWKKEVEKLLNNRVGEAVAQHQAQRDRGFAELSELSAQQDALLAEKKTLEEERAGLNMLKNADLKQANLMSMRLQKIDKQSRSLQKRIDALVGELSELPGDSPLLWLIERKEHGRV